MSNQQHHIYMLTQVAQAYISEHFANLLAEPDMEYAILSATESAERAKVLMGRIEAISSI